MTFGIYAPHEARVYCS
ncbi:hypothetical protein JEQ04_08370 [Serratia plymuthica]|nr:hypothetical protein [Serratia plymuthica]NIC29603.1 hypothetical protein [Serratia plymuthica]